MRIGIKEPISSNGRVYACSISFGEAPLLPFLYTTFAMASPRGDIDLAQEVKQKIKRFILATIVIFLTVVHVTAAVALAVLGDYLVVLLITILQGTSVLNDEFIKQVLEGVKYASVVGTALIYFVYLLYTFADSVKHVVALFLGREG